MNTRKCIRIVVFIISIIWAATYFCFLAIHGGLRLKPEILGLTAFFTFAGFCTPWFMYFGINWLYLWIKEDSKKQDK